MVNLVEAIRMTPTFKTFEVGEVLFAKYTCPLQERLVPIWTHHDHLIHVLTGRKTWKTAGGAWLAQAGDTVFFRKGAYVLQQDFQEDFCLLAFFLPDDFIRQIVRELAGELDASEGSYAATAMAIRVKRDAAIDAFLNSMATYFASDEKPPQALLRLKLRELITGILLSRRNPQLAGYFRSLGDTRAPALPVIMETSFCHNLPLDAYARMCHRSLSAFKREFQRCYGKAPGRWLLERRLDRASDLLRTTGMNITEIVFESGFESPSHFSRAFKTRFGCPPTVYREGRVATG